jgi:hypothetical protein
MSRLLREQYENTLRENDHLRAELAKVTAERDEALRRLRERTCSCPQDVYDPTCPAHGPEPDAETHKATRGHTPSECPDKCPRCGDCRHRIGSKPCCNWDCGGEWGTGCFHCHHSS